MSLLWEKIHTKQYPENWRNRHQLINTSATVELKFLVVSTKLLPEIVEYPDSGKFGVRAEFPGPDGKTELRFVSRIGESLNYWDDES